LTWHPNDSWRLSFNGDYLRTKFTSINGVAASYAVGDGIDLVPKYTFTVSVQRDFNWSGMPSFVRLDYAQQGPETYRNRYINGPPDPSLWYFAESDIIRMLNFRTGLRWNRNLSVGLFAQNLLNDRKFTSPLSLEADSPRSVRELTESNSAWILTEPAHAARS